MPPSKDTIERLQALAASDTDRTKAGRFRELFQHIDHALRAGVTQQRVVNELNASGLAITLPTFKNYLHRARAEQVHRPASFSAPSNSPVSPFSSTAKLADSVTPSPPAIAPGDSSHLDKSDPKMISAILHTPVDLMALERAGKKATKK